MKSGVFQADLWLAETSLVRVMRSSFVLCFCARIVQVRQPISHHDICNSAFILALTCSMTSAVTTAFLLAFRTFQSSDFTWSDRTAQSTPSTCVTTSNGWPLIRVDNGQHTMSPALPL